MLEQIRKEHEAVRTFVEKETGGIVEKIEGESVSRYHTEQTPTYCESVYTVDVVIEPNKTETLTVIDCGENFLISRRVMTIHRARAEYWT